MPDIEKFLEPIPGAKPTGSDLRYAPVYDKVREARRQEGGGPMGLWEREVKTADYKLVIKLCEEALIKNSKDLQIAAWLTEAWISRDRLPGLTSGLQLVHALIERFWDGLYPELDEGDAEPRATPVEWIGSYFDPGKGSSPILQVRSVPLTASGHNWFVYSESRRIGYDSEISGNDAKRKAKVAALAEGKLSPEDFDKDFEATPKSFYKQFEADCKEAVTTLISLDELCNDKFADVAPSFTTLRKAIDEVSNVAHILLLKKLEKEPDPVEAAPAAADGSEAGAPSESGAPTTATVSIALPTAAQIDLSQMSGGEIKSADQATLHVVAAAQFLRNKTPASPVSYMLLRALRWGEVRAAGDKAVDDLPAPASDVRVLLKASAAAKNWKRVLEGAEAAMSSASGRGWLDLQRYSIKACDELGYVDAAKALRSELKAFLTDYPQLASATLNDDTGTANPETLAWLRQEGLIS